MDKMIKDAIDAGVRHLCNDTLGLNVQAGASIGKGFYGASIPITFDKKEIDFYLFFKHRTLEVFAINLLGVDQLQEADLDDLCKELANQIVGKAKNILNEHEEGKFKLGTPEFLGQVDSFGIRFKSKFIYKLSGRTFYIGYKFS